VATYVLGYCHEIAGYPYRPQCGDDNLTKSHPGLTSLSLEKL